ncbi:hypothetical protein [Deinococcus peraridilitoris]|uniref:DdrH n=1 Tax=Deinococcus peraridilitoris (strain DSM 19664 / LMG 22246 / CIP 109416 / KR-200) TaxID=937777 RepID=K9ZZ88_DEIPD|nr:hypothetical protein [Deinococcus peraridilitoris]AFZ66514.1 hypothetical protein Deipe_0946 [Deinococcus peraridilitoris DSM 19664]
MSNPYAEWFERLRAEYGDQLSAMPLPEGLPEHLRDLMARGDEEAITLMIKLAWQFGAQVGYASAVQQTGGAALKPRRTVQA